MKLISEKDFNFIYGSYYIDYCFAVFYYNNLKVSQVATLQSMRRRSCAKMIMFFSILDETGVRGYIISENDVYLDTFNNAVKAMNSNLSLCQS
jgi:CHASE3 domain sensor protein